jgi:hypothetical protein
MIREYTRTLNRLIYNFIVFSIILISLKYINFVSLLETILTTCFIYYLTARLYKTKKSKTIILTLIFYLVYSFLLVNIDRSRSFYVLSWVKIYKISSNYPYDLSQIKSSEAINKFAITQRLTEQKNRKLIYDDGKYLKLTKSGNLILNLSNLLARVFKLENWFINKY